MNILKIATLNINGIHTPTRIAMLHDFLKNHDPDILFLQEVIHPNLGNLQGYTTYTNAGTTIRGTTFVTRNDLKITIIAKLRTGRGIAAECVGIRLLNVYAIQAERNLFQHRPCIPLAQ